MAVNARASRALEAVLPASVDVRSRGEFVLVNGQPLRVAWIGEGWLADVKTLLAATGERPDVVVAPRMSPGARHALADASVGWVDETGASEIAIDSLIVSKSGRTVTRDQRTTDWTPAVLAVAEALLCGGRATVAGAVEATGLSSGSCTNALRFLTEEGLLIADAPRGRHSARRISDVDQFLRAYAAAAVETSPGPEVQVGMGARDLADGLREIGVQWTSRRVDWACTGLIAASVLAPYVTSVGTADVYVSAETIAGLEAAARDVGLESIEGGRLNLRPFPTVAVPHLSTERAGLRVAPWPRVYADARIAGLRGEEAAEHLREVMGGE